MAKFDFSHVKERDAAEVKRKEIKQRQNKEETKLRFDEIIAELQELAKLPDKEYLADGNRKKVDALLNEAFNLYKSV